MASPVQPSNVYGFPLQLSPGGLSQEALNLNGTIRDLSQRFVSNGNIPSTDEDKIKIIKRVLLDCQGYVSLHYVTRKARLDKNDVARLIKSVATARLSYIKLPNGEPVYIRNSRFGWFKDVWRSFCYLNDLKY